MLQFRQWGREPKANGLGCERDFCREFPATEGLGALRVRGLAAERKALLEASANTENKSPGFWMLRLWSGASGGRYGGARRFSSGVRKLCSNWRTLIKALARASAGISNNSRLKVTSGIRV